MYQVMLYETVQGRKVVREFLRSLREDDRKEIGSDLMQLQIGYPMGMPLCKHLRDGLWELRSSLPSKREVRMLYFFDATTKTIIVVHGFIKKTQTTPTSDIDLGLKRKREFT